MWHYVGNCERWHVWPFRILADLRAVFHPLLRIRLGGKERLLGQMLDGNAFVSRKGASIAENWNGWPRSISWNRSRDYSGIPYYRSDWIRCDVLFSWFVILSPVITESSFHFKMRLLISATEIIQAILIIFMSLFLFCNFYLFCFQFILEA